MDLSRYYQEICKEPIMTRDEETHLIAIYKNPESPDAVKVKAKARIIKSNLRFVFKQAKYFSKNDLTMFEELIGAGNEGLLVGLEKYEPVHGKRFLTYAGHWVKQRILKEMSRMRIVSLPIWKQQLAAKIAKIKDNQENVSMEELKKEFPKASEKDIKELSNTKYLTYYIDDLEEGALEIDSLIINIEKEFDTKRLQEIVQALPRPQREIIILSFGLEDGKELKFTQIAKRLVMTRDQLKELKKEALEYLREKLSDE